MSLSLTRFTELLDAYGADPGRWPEAERAAALALLEASPQARGLCDEARALDAALDRLPTPAPSADFRLRVLATAPIGAAPARGLRELWGALGGWRLTAPALACALALGLAVGQWLPMPEAALTEDELYTLALLDDRYSYTEFEP